MPTIACPNCKAPTNLGELPKSSHVFCWQCGLPIPVAQPAAPTVQLPVQPPTVQLPAPAAPLKDDRLQSHPGLVAPEPPWVVPVADRPGATAAAPPRRSGNKALMLLAVIGVGMVVV